MSAAKAQWTLVETLVEGEFHIVARGGEPRSFDEDLSLQRISPESRVAVRPFIERAFAAGRRYEEFETVPNHHGAEPRRVRLLALPVVGPTAIHALQVWIAYEEHEPPPPRIAAGISWMLGPGVIEQTREAAYMSGVPPEEFVPQRTIAMYYSKSIRMDKTEELVVLGLNPEPGGRWEGSMSVMHADGHLMRWHQHAKSCANPKERGVRVLWHDVTDTLEPERPTLDVLATQRGLEAFGTYAALFRANPAYLGKWLCAKPAPWVSYWDARTGTDVYHEGDQALLTKAHQEIQAGNVPFVDIVARLRGVRDDEWIPTNMRVSAYPGQLGEDLVVVNMYLTSPPGQSQHP